VVEIRKRLETHVIRIGIYEFEEGEMGPRPAKGGTGGAELLDILGNCLFLETIAMCDRQLSKASNDVRKAYIVVSWNDNNSVVITLKETISERGQEHASLCVLTREVSGRVWSVWEDPSNEVSADENQVGRSDRRSFAGVPVDVASE
jgi:hypothetical protein